MICTLCNEQKDIHKGVFRENGMWPESTVKRYDFECGDCAGNPQKITIDGGPSIDPEQEYEQEFSPLSENPGPLF